MSSLLSHREPLAPLWPSPLWFTVRGSDVSQFPSYKGQQFPTPITTSCPVHLASFLSLQFRVKCRFSASLSLCFLFCFLVASTLA